MAVSGRPWSHNSVDYSSPAGQAPAMALDISPCVTDDDYDGVAAGADRGDPLRAHPVARRDAGGRHSPSGCCSWRARTARSSGYGLAQPLRDERGRLGDPARAARAPPARRRHRPARAPGRPRRRLSACATVRAGADDEGSVAFARRFGFEEVNREVEQTYRTSPGPVEADAPRPTGVEVVTAQDRPGLWEAALRTLRPGGARRLRRRHPARRQPRAVDAHWLGDPMFLALHAGEVVGCAGWVATPTSRSARRTASPPYAATGAAAASRSTSSCVTLAWAAEHGIDEVYTWTQDGNAAMRALNTRLRLRDHPRRDPARPRPLPRLAAPSPASPACATASAHHPPAPVPSPRSSRPAPSPAVC